MSKDGTDHLELLDQLDEVNALRSILNKLLSPRAEESTQDLAVYQPNHHQFEKQYHDLIRKEKNHEYLLCIMSIGVFCIILNILIGYM